MGKPWRGTLDLIKDTQDDRRRDQGLPVEVRDEHQTWVALCPGCGAELRVSCAHDGYCCPRHPTIEVECPGCERMIVYPVTWWVTVDVGKGTLVPEEQR